MKVPRSDKMHFHVRLFLQHCSDKTTNLANDNKINLVFIGSHTQFDGKMLINKSNFALVPFFIGLVFIGHRYNGKNEGHSFENMHEVLLLVRQTDQ